MRIFFYFILFFLGVLVLQKSSMITLSQRYRKFEHGRKRGDLSIGERKHPVKVTSPPGRRKPPNWKNLARSPVAAGGGGVLGYYPTTTTMSGPTIMVTPSSPGRRDDTSHTVGCNTGATQAGLTGTPDGFDLPRWFRFAQGSSCDLHPISPAKAKHPSVICPSRLAKHLRR